MANENGPTLSPLLQWWLEHVNKIIDRPQELLIDPDNISKPPSVEKDARTIPTSLTPVLFGFSAGVSYFLIEILSKAENRKYFWKKLQVLFRRGCSEAKKLSHEFGFTRIQQKNLPLLYATPVLILRSAMQQITYSVILIGSLAYHQRFTTSLQQAAQHVFQDCKTTLLCLVAPYKPLLFAGMVAYEYIFSMQKVQKDPPPPPVGRNTTVVFPPNMTEATNPAQKRYLEILVHNISHTDMVLETKDKLLCRPRFSCFDKYCRLLTTDEQMLESIVSFPRYERSIESPRFSIKENPRQEQCSTGLSIISGPHVDPAEMRFRGGASPTCTQLQTSYFPLLATLLPRWEQQISLREYTGPVKKLLVLVSGVGTPRNWTHSVDGNSTQACADLMEMFVNRADPSIVVVKIHSCTNIFRYDENILFVQRELMPVIDAYRDAHATGQPYPDEQSLFGPVIQRSDYEYDTEWRKSLTVTLSFADGSPARTHAIQVATRPYRPIYFHFWQLKTFWHESKIVDDDIEMHSFEDMEASPAVDVDRLQDPMIRMVVDEMKMFRDEMVKTLQGKNDIEKFWLRKTHKPVLAVLLVQTKDMDTPVLYRGQNMEVSMPTGSLCAERNVIGSALAENPALRREDLKVIAVLAVPLLRELKDSSLCRVSSSASIGSTTATPERPSDRKGSVGSEYEDWVCPPVDNDSVVMVDEPRGLDSTPVRRIQLFSRSAAARKPKRTVVVQSTKDLNPLKPCGSCNEWLKKIAECNPRFQIVTFTDADCHGVYCMPCQHD